MFSQRDGASRASRRIGTPFFAKCKIGFGVLLEYFIKGEKPNHSETEKVSATKIYFKYTIRFVQTTDFVCCGIVARMR